MTTTRIQLAVFPNAGTYTNYELENQNTLEMAQSQQRFYEKRGVTSHIVSHDLETKNYATSLENILFKGNFEDKNIDAIMKKIETFNSVSHLGSIKLIAVDLLKEFGRPNHSEFLNKNGWETYSKEWQVGCCSMNSIEQFIIDLTDNILFVEKNAINSKEVDITADSVQSLLDTIAPVESSAIASPAVDLKTSATQNDWVADVTGEMNLDISLESRKAILNCVKKQVSTSVLSFQKVEYNKTEIKDYEVNLIKQERQISVESEDELLTNLGFDTTELALNGAGDDDLKRLDEMIKTLQGVKNALVADKLVSENKSLKTTKAGKVLEPIVKKILTPIRKKATETIKEAGRKVASAFKKILSYKESSRSKSPNFETIITTDKVLAVHWLISNLKDLFKFNLEVDSIKNFGTSSNKITTSEFQTALGLLGGL